MEMNRAISEPMVRLIDFHNSFNMNLKFAYGALEATRISNDKTSPFSLPNGGEPWGAGIRWRDADAAAKDASAFLSEMGVVRAASAFEDYLGGATAELDRASSQVTPAVLPAQGSEENKDADDMEGTTAPVRNLVNRLGVASAQITADVALIEFFQISRNCIVHRSNRASRRLVEVRNSDGLAEALEAWPRRVGRWQLALPSLQVGDTIPWLPRHAIMASGCYHRLAASIDAALVRKLGGDGIAHMAAYWCILANNPVPSPAKLDAQTMVRTQLVQRYLVRHVTLAEVVQALRNKDSWDKIRQAFKASGVKRLSDTRPKRTRKRA